MEKNAGPPSGGSRPPTGAQGRVLAVLAQRASRTTLAELAEATGLHENTLRGHLDALHRAGYVSRLRVAPSGRGRPPWTYLTRERPHVALARALSRGLENTPGATAGEAGESGGRAWGEQLRELFDEDGQTVGERLMLALEHVGFGPDISGDTGTIRLTRCPFIDTAREHPDAVCGVHRGLIAGVLGESGGQARLHPFAEPGACLVALAAPVSPT